MIATISFQQQNSQADFFSEQSLRHLHHSAMHPDQDRCAARPDFAENDSGYTQALAISQLIAENRTLRATIEEQRKCHLELRLEMEKLHRLANTDPLTGLYNRRAMDQHLNALWDSQHPAPLSVLMLDIDHFKRINDTYGHSRGDLVLRHVAESLRRCLRAEDCAFRFGGEEFMVLLNNTSLEVAIKLAEAIRGRVEGLQMADRDGGRMPCTVSLGVASRKDHDDRESIFHRVDRALYQAKYRGRNQVVHENLLN